jgi:hypothetical protein
VQPVHVGPVALDRDGMEAGFLDQAAGEAGALAVEVVGAVGGLADQHHPAVACPCHDAVVVVAATGDRMSDTRELGAPASTMAPFPPAGAAAGRRARPASGPANDHGGVQHSRVTVADLLRSLLGRLRCAALQLELVLRTYDDLVVRRPTRCDDRDRTERARLVSLRPRSRCGAASST